MTLILQLDCRSTTESQLWVSTAVSLVQISGEVDQSAGMLDEEAKEKGYALMCVAEPQSDCRIKVIEEVRTEVPAMLHLGMLSVMAGAVLWTAELHSGLRSNVIVRVHPVCLCQGTCAQAAEEHCGSCRHVAFGTHNCIVKDVWQGGEMESATALNIAASGSVLSSNTLPALRQAAQCAAVNGASHIHSCACHMQDEILEEVLCSSENAG